MGEALKRAEKIKSSVSVRSGEIGEMGEMANGLVPQEEGPLICPRCGEELWWSPSLRDSQLEGGEAEGRRLLKRLHQDGMIQPHPTLEGWWLLTPGGR